MTTKAEKSYRSEIETLERVLKRRDNQIHDGQQELAAARAELETAKGALSQIASAVMDAPLEFLLNVKSVTFIPVETPHPWADVLSDAVQPKTLREQASELKGSLVQRGEWGSANVVRVLMDALPAASQPATCPPMTGEQLCDFVLSGPISERCVALAAYIWPQPQPDERELARRPRRVPTGANPRKSVKPILTNRHHPVDNTRP